MYNEITVDRSLLYIDQHHVDTFKSLAKKMDRFNFMIEDGGLPKQDAWIVAFNAWLLLLPDKYNIILSVEKTPYYSSNYVILNELLKDAHFIQLKNRKDASEELFYLAALTLGTKLNKWFLYIQKKYDLMHLKKRNNSISYFDSHKQSDEEVKRFLEDQAQFVKATIKEMNSTDSFQKTIKQACDDAFVIYTSHFVNQPYEV